MIGETGRKKGRKDDREGVEKRVKLKGSGRDSDNRREKGTEGKGEKK